MTKTSALNVEQKPVQIPSGRVNLEGNLNMPEATQGVVIFAHGSGSSRHSPRNRYVAEVLNQAGLATLLFDLLTLDEEQQDRLTGHLRFNIEFLADRLVTATEWLAQNLDVPKMPVGYFGASTGAGAALVAAARRPQAVEKKLEIVPGATHLFEEPGALENVAELACDWFERYLAGKSGGE